MTKQMTKRFLLLIQTLWYMFLSVFIIAFFLHEDKGADEYLTEDKGADEYLTEDL